MKPFRTIQEQVALLQSRGLVVDDTAEAERFLLFENYYNVVNGYKELFYKAGETDVFEEGTTFGELVATFKFDAGLRGLFLPQLLHIENNIKTLVAYVFSRNHGETAYMDANNFDYSEDNKEGVNNLIGVFSSTIRNGGKTPMIDHYLREHDGKIPLWVLVDILTFGNISFFYRYMKQKDKNDVARQYKIQPDILGRYLRNLDMARNCCAHGERFFNIRFRTRISAPPELAGLGLHPDKARHFPCGQDDLFSVFLMIKRLSRDNDAFICFATALSNAVKDIRQNVKGDVMGKMLCQMGFPENWEEVIR